MKADLMFALSRPLLAVLDPERAHGLTVEALKLGLGGTASEADDPILTTTVWNLTFPNPVGLAAGFDKHAEVCDAMLALGFGFVEAGTVTPRPQPGNSGQRLFRLAEDEAVINRFGFNSCGIAPFAGRLAKRRAAGMRGIVGANLGKNRDTADGAADYIACVEAMTGLADYLVVNVSSPNTPGLRALQARAQIEELISRVNEARRASPVPKQPPLLVKVGPDLDESEIRGIAEVALAASVDGLIVGNTTVARPSSLKSRLCRASRCWCLRPTVSLRCTGSPTVASPSSDAAASRAAPTPTRRSAPAPRWCSSTPRWCSAARDWSAASSASSPPSCAPMDTARCGRRWGWTCREAVVPGHALAQILE
jgi:dihydroorotate dehydrogenase